MAPAPTSTHETSENSPQPTAVFTIVTVPASTSIITTTITSGGVPSLPTVGAVRHSNVSDIPVAAIAGGTAAGVVLALCAVIGWTWWGKCIHRKKVKERKEALAYLEVRENTRKNASSLSNPANPYRPAFSIRGNSDRKVKFASSAPASSQSTLRGTAEYSKEAKHMERPPLPGPVPRPPTPSARTKDVHRKPEADVPPPLPRRNPQRDRSTMPPADPSEPPQHRLMHQASTLSSGSVYSTQSAIEERQNGVPSSLLLALANEGSRRSLLAQYLPWNRYRTSVASNNRLSEYSTGSVYSQFDDQPWESVGYAIGGDDEQGRR